MSLISRAFVADGICGIHNQRQHQNSFKKGPWLQESRLLAAQGSPHGGHQDRIHRPSESRLSCARLRILVQSRKAEDASRSEVDFSLKGVLSVLDRANESPRLPFALPRAFCLQA